MSKLGKKPIIIPKDAKVKFESGKLTMTGPKGSKELNLNDKIFSASIKDNNLTIIQRRYNKIYNYPIKNSPFVKILYKKNLINFCKKTSINIL